MTGWIDHSKPTPFSINAMEPDGNSADPIDFNRPVAFDRPPGLKIEDPLKKIL